MDSFCTEEASEARRLADALESFYRTTQRYDAFNEVNAHHQFWRPIVEEIGKVIATKGHCVVLEFGAGRTGFAAALGSLRSQVTLHVQDVTPQNAEYLATQADQVHIGDLTEVGGCYDVIFSTFVWEHLSAPRTALHHLTRLLAPVGAIYLASPRYDFPFYISPSARHLPISRRAMLAIWLLWRRAMVLASRRPDFLLHADPAVLRGPWFRDADAIHWVSLWDMKYALDRSWLVERVRLPARGAMGRFYESFMLMFVKLSRRS